MYTYITHTGEKGNKCLFYTNISILFTRYVFCIKPQSFNFLRPELFYSRYFALSAKTLSSRSTFFSATPRQVRPATQFIYNASPFS